MNAKRACIRCGTRLQTTGRPGRALYCTKLCAMRAKADRERKKYAELSGRDTQTVLTDRVCAYCASPIGPTKNLQAKYCSMKCGADARREKARPRMPGATPLANTGLTGALHELIASADLTRRGFYVFRAIAPSSPCDLIAMKGPSIYRIEVKTAHRQLNGSLTYYIRPHQKEVADVIALVMYDGQVEYLPPLEEYPETQTPVEASE